MTGIIFWYHYFDMENTDRIPGSRGNLLFGSIWLDQLKVISASTISIDMLFRCYVISIFCASQNFMWMYVKLWECPHRLCNHILYCYFTILLFIMNILQLKRHLTINKLYCRSNCDCFKKKPTLQEPIYCSLLFFICLINIRSAFFLLPVIASGKSSVVDDATSEPENITCVI